MFPPYLTKQKFHSQRPAGIPLVRGILSRRCGNDFHVLNIYSHLHTFSYLVYYDDVVHIKNKLSRKTGTEYIDILEALDKLISYLSEICEATNIGWRLAILAEPSKRQGVLEYLLDVLDTYRRHKLTIPKRLEEIEDRLFCEWELLDFRNDLLSPTYCPDDIHGKEKRLQELALVHFRRQIFLDLYLPSICGKDANGNTFSNVGPRINYGHFDKEYKLSIYDCDGNPVYKNGRYITYNNKNVKKTRIALKYKSKKKIALKAINYFLKKLSSYEGGMPEDFNHLCNLLKPELYGIFLDEVRGVRNFSNFIDRALIILQEIDKNEPGVLSYGSHDFDNLTGDFFLYIILLLAFYLWHEEQLRLRKEVYYALVILDATLASLIAQLFTEMIATLLRQRLSRFCASLGGMGATEAAFLSVMSARLSVWDTRPLPR